MTAETYFEEEEFSNQFNGKTIQRILGQTRQHWKWVAGFLITVGGVSMLDGYLTYLSKQIIDRGIIPGDRLMVILSGGRDRRRSTWCGVPIEDI